MAACAYGKASLVFPLSISSGAALGVLEATEDAPAFNADVTGYSTPLTVEAGACSVRFELQHPDGADCAPGNYVAAVRAHGQEGWLPGLANTLHANGRVFLEVVVLGRPDKKLKALMYLPSDTLSALWPHGQGPAGVRLLQPLLLPQMSDCPGQWLRDRLLKLADIVEGRFQPHSLVSHAEVGQMLSSAGLHLTDAPPESLFVGPADAGERIDDQELGYWKEEMDHGHHCAGSMDGNHRLDAPDDIIASML